MAGSSQRLEPTGENGNDEILKKSKETLAVIPAKAGIQAPLAEDEEKTN